MLRKKQSARKTTGTINDDKQYHIPKLVVWRSYNKPVLQTQLDILRDGLFSDVTFVVGKRKERIPCHKLFLKIRSPVFEVMFDERCNQDIPREIPLEDVNPKSFKKFLKFIYADEFNVDVPQALELLQLAQKYDVLLLIRKCEEKLKDEVTLDNAVAVFQAARKYYMESLMDTIGDMWPKSLSEFQTLPSFTELDKETLMYILKRDDLEMKEVDVFRLALQWAGNQTDATVEESLEDIFPLIRFPTMTLNEFTTIVVPTKVLHPARVMELLAYFGTDDKTKRWSMARTLGLNSQQRQPKDLAHYVHFYSDYGMPWRRHQKFESLKECLQFHESLSCLRQHSIEPEDLILGIGLSGFSFHCPVASERVRSPSLKSFKICLKSKDCHDDQYDYSSDQSYTELLNMSSVDVEEGKNTDVRFDALVPLKKSTLYCITIEEITSAEGDAAVQGYEADDFGPGPKKHLFVSVKHMGRTRTALAVQRNKLQGFRTTGSADARPTLISRLGFRKL